MYRQLVLMISGMLVLPLVISEGYKALLHKISPEQTGVLDSCARIRRESHGHQKGIKVVAFWEMSNEPFRFE
jgi:hypothetical protein